MYKWMRDIRCKHLAKKYKLSGDFNRIYLLHIRKSGGTSLNQMFLSLGKESGEELYSKLPVAAENRIISDRKVFVGWNKRMIEEGNYFYAFSHIPYHKLNLPPKTLTITCLRNPVERVISHYKMLLNFKRNNIHHPCMVEEGKWLGNGFEDFLKNIPECHLKNQLFMFSSDYNIDEAYSNIISTSFFFFTEDFDAGINILSKKIGYTLHPLHIRKNMETIDIDKRLIEVLESMVRPESILYERLRDLYLRQY